MKHMARYNIYPLEIRGKNFFQRKIYAEDVHFLKYRKDTIFSGGPYVNVCNKYSLAKWIIKKLSQANIFKKRETLIVQQL